MRYPDKQYQTWLGGEFVRIGIDYNYDRHLLDKISAGLVSHFGDFSFSSALKILKNKRQRDQSPIPRFEQIFDAVERRFRSTSLKFLKENRPDNVIADENVGVIHAELFLLRLLSSFIAVRRLLNWGFFSEPLTILRGNLEQLAWIYAVGIDFDQKQLENPNPSKCIGAFKRCFPAAGYLYGALSRFSHMDFEAQKHFIIDSEPGAGVMQQSIEFKFFGLLFYSFLLIAYQYVCRDIRKFYSERCGLEFHLSNVVLPIRYLMGHALMQPDLDRDEIAATLSLIYFDTFPPKAK